ncbi:unnamed protein product [Lupinus luteus]|uniref:Inositol oxygenase n=1 Tax=Lupinus luteus TaxID=3873 RepID=A0AAV1XK01_LUPLU
MGDTFPLSCGFDESNVHHKYFKVNADYNNPAYNTKNGIYLDGVGLDNVIMSFGHDDYIKYDLYSKSKVRVDVEKVKPYYMSLIQKYFPAKLRWKGGHAVDAAVAAALCLGVVSQASSGIGGGSFMLLRSTSTSQTHAFDMRETAPSASSQV